MPKDKGRDRGRGERDDKRRSGGDDRYFPLLKPFKDTYLDTVGVTLVKARHSPEDPAVDPVWEWGVAATRR